MTAYSLAKLYTQFEDSDTADTGQVATIAGPVVYGVGYAGQGRQVAEGTTNLVTNPSFETNITGWTAVTSVLSQNTSRGYIGPACLRVTWASTTTFSTYFSHSLSGATAGRIFSGRGVIYAEGGMVGKTIQIRLTEVGGASGQAFSSTSVTLAAGWNFLSVSRSVAQNDRTAIRLIFLRPTGAASGEYFDVDAAQMEEKSYPTPYADGSLPGHSWTSTAHASTSTRPAATLRYANPLDTPAGELSLWWKPAAANTGPTAYFFDEGNLEAYFNSADDRIYLTDGTNTISTAALTFAADVGQDLRFTWSVLNGLAIYRNGVLAASGASYKAPAFGANLYVGSDAAGANQANGLIDDLAVWVFPPASVANSEGRVTTLTKAEQLVTSVAVS